MGRDLFDCTPEFSEAEADIDGILGYSLRTLCLENPDKKLQQTQYTQPALYVVNYLHYCKATRDGRSPEIIAGHSLGEYNALQAAGAFDLLDGLRLVKRRGELMARAKNGAMAAIIGLPAKRIEDVLRSSGLSTIDVANYNAPAQTVISGPVEAIARAEDAFRGADVRLFVRLPVSAAFHSRYMAEAAAEFRTFLKTFKFRDLQTQVMSNVTGRPYPEGSTDGIIKARLAEQIVSPVRWETTIQYLKGRGETEFLELGPGTVLTKLNQQILAEPTLH
jgi:malonyl CoA-acyl carrier protein transacylase